MRNKFAAPCYRCGETVPAGEGYFERCKGSWRVQHIECCKAARKERTEAFAKAEGRDLRAQS